MKNKIKRVAEVPIMILSIWLITTPMLMHGQNAQVVDSTELIPPKRTVFQLLSSDFVAQQHITGYLVISDDRRLIAKGIRLHKFDGSRIDVYFKKEIPYRQSFSNPCILDKKLGRQKIDRMYLIKLINKE